MFRYTKKNGENYKMLGEIRWICMQCGEVHGFFADSDVCSVCGNARQKK